MITIPEGMGFDQLGDGQRLIDSVSRRKAKPYSVVPGTIRENYDTDRDWAYDAAREGAPPNKFRIADMNLVDRKTKQRYLRITDADTVDMPTQTVKIVGHDTIAPETQNPNFAPVRGNVVVPMPEDIMAEGDVEVYRDSQDFEAEGPIVDIPGFPGRNTAFPGLPPGVLRQKFPKKSGMQMPDGLIYDQPSNITPGWDERQDVHELYDEEGEAAAAVHGMGMGILRVEENVPLEQFDIIASVAASVIQAGASGYGIYSKIAADKREKKAMAEMKKQNAIQSAAMFDQQFSQQYSQSLAPQAPGQVVMTPQGPMTVAPFSEGVDWMKIGLFGGGAVVLVGLAWFLLKE